MYDVEYFHHPGGSLCPSPPSFVFHHHRPVHLSGRPYRRSHTACVLLCQASFPRHYEVRLIHVTVWQWFTHFSSQYAIPTMSKPQSIHSSVDRSLGCLQFLNMKSQVAMCIPAHAFLKKPCFCWVYAQNRNGWSCMGCMHLKLVDPARQYPGEAELLFLRLLFSEKLRLHTFSPPSLSTHGKHLAHSTCSANAVHFWRSNTKQISLLSTPSSQSCQHPHHRHRWHLSTDHHITDLLQSLQSPARLASSCPLHRWWSWSSEEWVTLPPRFLCSRARLWFCLRPGCSILACPPPSGLSAFGTPQQPISQTALSSPCVPGHCFPGQVHS